MNDHDNWTQLRDANGNVTRITDQNGTLIDQGFDDLDRLIGRDLTLASGVGATRRRTSRTMRSTA